MSIEDNEHALDDRKTPRGRLTTARTFVLQFREQIDDTQDWLDGRIEHLASGRAVMFSSQEDLFAFLKEALGEAY